MKRALLTITVLVFAVLFAQAQDSSVPARINYQGKLTDVNGNPLEGEHKLEFNIWNQASLGTKLWGPQTFTAVQVIGGHFNVVLGPTDSSARSILDAFADSERYLEILIDDSVISPRQRILSAPYALNALNAMHAMHGVPVGSVMPYFGRSAPEGWLLCDGTSLLTLKHPKYENIKSHLESLGMSSLPDLRGRFPLGIESPEDLNQTGGEKEVALTEAQMPTHSHQYWDIFFAENKDWANYDGSWVDIWKGMGSGDTDYSNVGFQTGRTTAATGEGQPHNNLPPYVKLNFIIKY